MTDDEIVYRVNLDGGEIDEEKAREVITELHYASTEYPGCQIEFVINSPGGAIEDGSAIYSELYAMSHRGGGEHYVTTKIRGKCASMATVIFQAGDWRVGGALDRLVFHEAKVCAHNEFVSDVLRDIADIEAWEVVCLDILMTRAKVERWEIDALTGPRDRQVMMPEAIRLGLADEIA